MRLIGHMGSIQQLMLHICGIVLTYCHCYFFLKNKKITLPIIDQIENTLSRKKYLLEPKVCMM